MVHFFYILKLFIVSKIIKNYKKKVRYNFGGAIKGASFSTTKRMEKYVSGGTEELLKHCYSKVPVYHAHINHVN